jgi:beta-glucosidase
MKAGVDMEMASDGYEKHVEALIEQGRLSLEHIEDAARRILMLKFQLGLFDNPYTDPSQFPAPANKKHMAAARETALQSIVLLKNDNVLPLEKDMKRIAVFGPMADDEFEQLGTWTFDKHLNDTVTPLQALREFAGDTMQTDYLPVLDISRSTNREQFEKAVSFARKADAILLFMGEEAIITGEAHCRADISLPGAQEALILELNATGKPIILTIMAGRPLILGNILDKVDGLLFSFHPGTMGGPALVDILFGKESPSGKLPVTYPKAVGQVPLYYSHKNTGRPPLEENFTHIDDIPVRAIQNSLGNESHYIDAGYQPQFVFGFGLSYTEFIYSDLSLSEKRIKIGEAIKISATVTNAGSVEADEVVQLYIRDLVASITRPVKELKGFRRIRLAPGAAQQVEFILPTEDLAFYNQNMERVTEPGKYHIWIAGDSDSGLMGEFEIVK